jgi:WD40 repeat protein
MRTQQQLEQPRWQLGSSLLQARCQADCFDSCQAAVEIASSASDAGSWTVGFSARHPLRVFLHLYCCSYDEGRCWYAGVGHSGEVTALAVAPDKSAVVSVGAEGGIFIWDYIRPPMSQAE